MGDGAAFGAMLRRRWWVLVAAGAFVVVAILASWNVDTYAEQADVSFASDSAVTDLLEALDFDPGEYGWTDGAYDDGYDDYESTDDGDPDTIDENGYSIAVDDSAYACANGRDGLPAQFDVTDRYFERAPWIRITDVRIAPTMIDFLDDELVAAEGKTILEVAITAGNDDDEVLHPSSQMRVITSDKRSRIAAFDSAADWMLGVDPGDTRSGVLLFVVPKAAETSDVVVMVGDGMYGLGDAEQRAEAGDCVRVRPKLVERVGDHPDIVREAY